jgi:hypothetical protein
MAHHHVPAVTIEARRALVAEAVATRTPYRQIAERLGVSFGTVAGDVEALRKDWRKSYGDLGGLLTQTAMDLDRWQARMESNLNALAADEASRCHMLAIGNVFAILPLPVCSNPWEISVPLPDCAYLVRGMGRGSHIPPPILHFARRPMTPR